MSSPYLYEMRHTFDEEGLITVCFMFDKTMTGQVDQLEVGQDLSHFAHRLRRSFMLSVHYSYLQGGTYEEFAERLSSSPYSQYVERLGLRMTSVCCHTTSCLYNNMDCVSNRYCICLMRT